MKVITAPEHYDLQPGEISVFLAGGITNCEDWQTEVIKLLQKNNYPTDIENLVIFNPRRENFPINDPNAAQEQIEWEFNALEKCDIFSMYFSGGDSDQPICMYEIGRNIVRMQMKHPLDWMERIIITVEKGYKREQDVRIQTQLACGELFIPMSQWMSFAVETHEDQIITAYGTLLE